MSLQREGARMTREGIVMSVPMNWAARRRRSCRTGSTRRVRSRGIRGRDRAADGSGVLRRGLADQALLRRRGGDRRRRSVRHAGRECEPKTWSKTVKIQDKGVVRHDDEWWMNHRETWGKLTYIKDTQSYPTPERKEIEPRIPLASLDGVDPAAPPAQQAFYERSEAPPPFSTGHGAVSRTARNIARAEGAATFGAKAGAGTRTGTGSWTTRTRRIPCFRVQERLDLLRAQKLR